MQSDEAVKLRKIIHDVENHLNNKCPSSGEEYQLERRPNGKYYCVTCGKLVPTNPILLHGNNQRMASLNYKKLPNLR